ncbi:hypothetical protein ES703_111952 [subsurface metagenome]
MVKSPVYTNRIPPQRDKVKGDCQGAGGPFIVRFIPGLNCAALSARPRQDKQLLLWYCLRSIDAATGRGVLLQDITIETLKQHYGYQRGTAYKHLAAGDGVYWQVHHSTRNGQTYIILRSLWKVVAHLGVDITKGARFVNVNVSALPPSSQVLLRRSLLYNTGAYRPFAIQRNDPISRKSLEKKTGVQERQQRRYDSAQERQGFPVRQTTKAFYRDPGNYKLRKHIRIIYKGIFEKELETHQLPNRYRTWHTGSSRGMLHKVSFLLNRGDKSSISGKATSSEGRQRRYYSSFKTFCRAHLRGQNTDRGCYYPCRSNDNKYVLGEIW